MYNHKLDTFLTVADSGSFHKASEKLFISPTAIMKQMNGLENDLGLTLFQREQRGISLTKSGKLIYKEALFLKQHSENSIAQAKKIEQQSEKVFSVGTSLLNPAKPFMDLWYKINEKFSDYKLHLVPFDDDNESILSVISQLGRSFDFLIGVCDSKSWMSLCDFFPLGEYRKMIAVSREHPLAQKSKLKMEDLYGETLLMVKEGDSGVNDFLRNDLRKNYPNIQIEDTPHFYDLSVFNHCAETNKLLLTLECWQNVHPGLVTIPVQWEYSIPYGILYSFNATEEISDVVNEIQKVNLS